MSYMSANLRFSRIELLRTQLSIFLLMYPGSLTTARDED